MLYAENVYVRFGGLTAVDNVSLHIKPGEIHAIIGPNGAGKSTFFNAISGINKPSEGKFSFLGQDITGLNQHQIAARGIGRTFQNIKLFNSMTVLENVVCGCHMNVRSSMFQDMFGTKKLIISDAAYPNIRNGSIGIPVKTLSIEIPTETETPMERAIPTDFCDIAPFVISLTCLFKE